MSAPRHGETTWVREGANSQCYVERLNTCNQAESEQGTFQLTLILSVDTMKIAMSMTLPIGMLGELREFTAPHSNCDPSRIHRLFAV